MHMRLMSNSISRVAAGTHVGESMQPLTISGIMAFSSTMVPVMRAAEIVDRAVIDVGP